MSRIAIPTEGTVNQPAAPSQYPLGLQGPESSGELDLRSVFGAFLRFRWLVIGTMVLSIAAAAIWYKTTPRTFESESKFLIKTDDNQGAGLSDLMALAGVRQKTGSSFNPSSYIEEIVLGEDLFRGLIHRPFPFGGDTLFLHQVWKLVPDKSRPDWEYAFEQNQMGLLESEKRIQVEKGKTNSLIHVTTLFESPELSLAVNKFVLDYVSDYTLNKLATQAKQNRKFIEERIKESSRDLERSERALKEFRLRNLSITSPDLQMQMSRLFRDQKVQEEIYLELVKQLELAKIEEYKNQPLVEVIAEPAKAIGPAWPRKTIILGICLLAGMVASSLAVGIAQAFWRKPGPAKA